MPSLDKILAQGGALNESHRAAHAWRRILDKPTAITLKRGSEMLDEQTVRIEHSEAANQRKGQSGEATVRQVTIFGVRNHPDEEILDTDIRANDRFVYSSVEYQVKDVVVTLGEVQARCEAVQ